MSRAAGTEPLADGGLYSLICDEVALEEEQIYQPSFLGHAVSQEVHDNMRKWHGIKRCAGACRSLAHIVLLEFGSQILSEKDPQFVLPIH